MQNLFDKQYNIDGFDMSLKEILTQLLFNGGAWNQLKVNIDAIKSWLQDRYGIDSRDLTFNDDQEFYTYIDNLPVSQLKKYSKTIIEESLKCNNQKCEAEFFIKTSSNSSIRKDALRVLLDITPKAGGEQPIPSAEPPAEPPVGPTQPGVEPSRPIEIELPSRTGVDKLYGDAVKNKRVETFTDEEIECNSRLVVYEGIPLDRNHEFFMIIPENIHVTSLCAAIVKPNTKEAAVIGNLKVEGEKTYFVAEKENIFIDVFLKPINKNNANAEIVLFPKESESYLLKGKFDDYKGALYAIKCRVSFQQLELCKRTLCIDFGTSNTTVGSYNISSGISNSVELVNFLDVSDNVYKCMVPTIVYVDKVEYDDEGAKVSYLFGYDAQKKIIEKDFTPDASVFREIKRWMGSLDENEKITDEDGNEAVVKRRDIVKAYIEFIIARAESWFKVKFNILHFTTPVKMKDKYINEFMNMLEPQFTFKGADVSIDEGAAVIYNHIREEVLRDLKIKKLKEKKKDNEKEEGKDNEKNNGKEITVIDCGGGTTDVAHCIYSFIDREPAPKLIIETQYESGNSNYAGNNITYRILQLLKIKIANMLKYHRKIYAYQLISSNEGGNTEESILEAIDKGHDGHVMQKIYETFNKCYAEAEDVVPTLFGDDFNGTSAAKKKHKRNYYYLWEMAEELKKQFFKTDKVRFDFSDENDVKLCIGSKDYYLYCNENGKLEKKIAPLQDIEVTFKEVNRVIFADIYKLLVDVMPKTNKSDYKSKYKLSGQSCNISLFHDLLKEFIPGKLTRTTSSVSAKDTSSLKMNCIKGSIEYMMDKDYGIVEPSFSMKKPKLNYVVRCESQKIQKINCLMQNGEHVEMNAIELPDTSKEVIFDIYNANGDFINKINYQLKLNMENAKTCNNRDLIDAFTNDTYLDSKDVCKLVDEITGKDRAQGQTIFCIVTVPDKSGYGFNVFELSIGDTYELLGDGQYSTYYSFVNDRVETFFAGNR